MPFAPTDKFTKLNEKLRKDLKMPSETSVFYFIKNQTVKPDALFGDLYSKNKSEDGFLYITAKGMDSQG